VEQQTLETKLRRTYRGVRHLSKISTVWNKIILQHYKNS
jgi:hypothetical protein